MPMIDLTLPEGALGEEARARLVERMTETVARWVGATDVERAARTIWCYVSERPAETVFVGGRPAREPRYRLQVTAGEGALDASRKEGLVAELTRHVLEAEGSPDEPANAARVWCHVHDLPDGNWGAVGRIWRMGEIAQFAGLELPSAEGDELAAAR